MYSIVEYKTLISFLIEKLPSLSTSAKPISMLVLGILTLLKVAQPLSLVEYPTFGPKSPVLTPGKCLNVCKSLSGTIKQWIPYELPSITSLANKAACVVKRPSSPGQNFVAVGVGVWIMNSSVVMSRVAVVSSPITSDPWPSSV